MDKNLAGNAELIAFLKKYSPVDNNFIDDFFGLYDATAGASEFLISLDSISKWLGSPKFNLNKTLKASYEKDVDYIVYTSI